VFCETVVPLPHIEHPTPASLLHLPRPKYKRFWSLSPVPRNCQCTRIQ